MLIYEVTVEVEPEIEEEFLAWLRAHVGDMAGLDEILDARMYRVIEPEEKIAFVSQYRMESLQAYESYLENHAARMRGDAVERFGGRFSASRRVLDAVDS